jgi:protein SCO1
MAGNPFLTRRSAIEAMLAGALVGCGAVEDRVGVAPVARARGLFDMRWIWTDDLGVEGSLSRWRGDPLVLTVFYASCTDRCPLTIDKLRSVEDAYHRHGRAVNFVLVTLDPQKDDIARLRRFKEAERLPASWHLLRGSLPDTRELGGLLHVRGTNDSGHVDHDVRIAIYDARGVLVRSFDGWDFNVEESVVGD